MVMVLAARAATFCQLTPMSASSLTNGDGGNTEFRRLGGAGQQPALGTAFPEADIGDLHAQ